LVYKSVLLIKKLNEEEDNNLNSFNYNSFTLNLYMKYKILNLSLILTSLIGYLEWGGGNNMFLIQGEIEVVSKLFSNPNSVIHPLTLLPLLGQVLLIFTLFQRNPSKILTFLGMGSLGVLLLLMFVIGLMNVNFKIIASVLPFLITGFFTIRSQLGK